MAKEKKRAGSLAKKLKNRLFFRMLGTMLALDVLLLCLCAGGCFVWAEDRLAGAARLVESQGLPRGQAALWARAGGCRVEELDRPPQGARLRFFLPDEATREGLRSFSFQKMTYTLEQETSKGQAYSVALELSGMAAALGVCWGILLAGELISLIKSRFKTGAAVEKSLQPLSQLAQTASELGTAAGDAGTLAAITGQLADINAAHLDERIPVEGTQKELAELARAINAMLERIDSAYAAQSRFVSDASHELRTPIAVIQGYARLLDRWGKDDPAARQEAIDAIAAEAESMKELVERLLFLARGENETIPVEMTWFDGGEMAGEVLKETAMTDCGHPLRGDWAEGVTVYGDRGLLKEALRVLVDNAVKYTPQGGAVTLAIRREGETARLSVTDQGEGISQKDLPHVFERFYRADQSRNRNTGGSGLGLSIVRWIAERHNGWAEAVSGPGLGTRFTIVLPQKQPGSSTTSR